jgi:hypothetical protein
MMPLDLWVYDALKPTGFWMYHGGKDNKGPASWFIISSKNSYLIQTWKQAADNYWKNRKNGTDEYFWMDGLFNNLLKSDKRFLKEWNKVPYLSCEDPGQAHMLAEKTRDNNPELKKILTYNPPYAVKLSFHGCSPNENDAKDTNMYTAIKEALTQEHAPYPLHKMT